MVLIPGFTYTVVKVDGATPKRWLSKELWFRGSKEQGYWRSRNIGGSFGPPVMNRVWYDNTQRYDVRKTFLYTPFSLTYVPPPGAHGAHGSTQSKVRSWGIKLGWKFSEWQMCYNGQVKAKAQDYWQSAAKGSFLSAAKGFRNGATTVQQVEALTCSMNIAFISNMRRKPRFGKTLTILCEEVPMKKMAEVSFERIEGGRR